MQAKQINHIGIDYGSKLAGTTVICYGDENNNLSILQSKKKENADQMILTFCERHQVDRVFIDAPLSLPGVYKNPDSYSDYFYRKADKVTQAMSPMFLGGLTARAMKLSDSISSPFYEVYPKLLVNTLDIKVNYKNDLDLFLSDLQKYFVKINLPQVDNWHQADAILAYLSGKRYLSNNYLKFGDSDEGQIYV